MRVLGYLLLHLLLQVAQLFAGVGQHAPQLATHSLLPLRPHSLPEQEPAIQGNSVGTTSSISMHSNSCIIVLQVALHL